LLPQSCPSEDADLRRAKLQSLFHDLRRAFATLVASDPERSERELQAWLSHADLRTMERYRHYRPLKTAAQRISRIFQSEIENAVPDGTVVA
jgi:integrase